MKFVFGLLCCAAVAYAVLPPDSVDGPPYAVLPPDAVGGPPYARMFKEFKAKYNRVYRNEVEVMETLFSLFIICNKLMLPMLGSLLNYVVYCTECP